MIGMKKIWNTARYLLMLIINSRTACELMVADYGGPFTDAYASGMLCNKAI